ncbi:MAG: cytochrome c3 family protein [Acidobacteriota bacterium]|nr:cytochrome c3 family protein [Acidobacteriota bacterium]
MHQAVQMGCNSCHEILNTNAPGAPAVTRIRLLKPTSVALCATCHSDIVNASHPHAPVKRNCLTCHTPHVSEEKGLLKKDLSGEKGKNLCLDCHKQGLETPKGGSRHAALDMGCNTCHATHKSGDDCKPETRYHLVKAEADLCKDCHDPQDPKLQKAHHDQPVNGSDCLSCHDPHESRSPKLQRATLHSPYQMQACDSCHLPAKDGKVVLVNNDRRTLCVTCHADQVEATEKAPVQHPGAASDCTDCHDAHGSKSQWLMKPDPVNACLPCHQQQAEEHKKAHPHDPVFQQGCTICHMGHGGNNQHLLRVASPNALCLECHGTEVIPQPVENTPEVTIFDGKVRLPDTYFHRIRLLSLEHGTGHPVKNHPVTDVLDLNAPGKVKASMNCLTCHQPHSSANRALLVKDQAPDMAFCRNCHNNASDLKSAGTKIGDK